MFQTTNYPLVMTNITNLKITMLLLGKLTISMAMFQFAIFVYQSVWFLVKHHVNRLKKHMLSKK